MKLTLTRVGNSLGFILPKEIVDQLGLAKGDKFAAAVDGESLHLHAVRAITPEEIGAAKIALAKRAGLLKTIAEMPDARLPHSSAELAAK